MDQKSFGNMLLFEEESVDSVDSDKLLHFRKPLLVEALSHCRAIESLLELRNFVFTLKRRTNDVSDPLRSNGNPDDMVTFGKAYLLAELDQISESLTIERAHYYIDRLIKSVNEVRTSSVNDINLNRWKEYGDIVTDSLWMIDRRDSSGVHTAGYWGNFIPQIPNQMMRRYTKKGDWVLDTFAGSGTTLIEGQRLGRNTIGIELQPKMVDHVNNLILSERNDHRVIANVVHGDSSSINLREVLKHYGKDSVQLVIMHPPYHDIIKFSDDSNDLSNAPSVEAFIEMMGKIVDNAASVLDNGRYLVVVIGDKYVKGDWVPIGFQVMNDVMKRGFTLKSIIVKNFDETTGKRNQKELWRYRALVGGFYVFKHEYIFLFKKSKLR